MPASAREGGGTDRTAADSLYGDGLGQVAGLVDGAPSQVGDVVGQQLEGDDGEEGDQGLVGLGEAEHVLTLVVHLVVVLRREGECGRSAAVLPCGNGCSRLRTSSVMRMMDPSRASTSSTLDLIFSYVASVDGAMKTTGMKGSIRAMGPCFISAAG